MMGDDDMAVGQGLIGDRWLNDAWWGHGDRLRRVEQR